MTDNEFPPPELLDDSPDYQRRYRAACNQLFEVSGEICAELDPVDTVGAFISVGTSIAVGIGQKEMVVDLLRNIAEQLEADGGPRLN